MSGVGWITPERFIDPHPEGRSSDGGEQIQLRAEETGSGDNKTG
jgi:hypothetical protein